METAEIETQRDGNRAYRDTETDTERADRETETETERQRWKQSR